MGKIKVIFDREGNTLNVWFADPKLEFSCEETGEEVILVKDKKGNIIGFEELSYLKRPSELKELEVESIVR
jgi:uncharacterized protein YuzE